MTELQLPRFLVMRFAPGSAGNFLTSLLQCSPEVGHWDENLEHNKPDADWLEYFKQVYKPDLGAWLQHEPSSRYSLGVREVFSAIYDRGNDLTIEEFAEQEKIHCSAYYFALKHQQKYIPVFWMKNYFPQYFANSTFVNIMLDQQSVRWFDRSYYKKHFVVDTINADGSLIVRYERHRATIVPQSFTGTNSYKNYHPSFTDFAKKEIFSNPWRSRYLGRQYLQASTNGRPEYTLTLSDLLDIKKLEPHYAGLCKFLNITPMPASLLPKLFSHWRQCHDY